jgi:hypothetical protein
MPSLPLAAEDRRSKRIISKAPRASLIVDLDRIPKRLPCLVLDFSESGFRLHSSVSSCSRSLWAS